MRIDDDVAWTADESRVVVMHLADRTATPFVLGDSAAVIWQELAEGGPLTSDSLLQRIAEHFAVEPGAIRADVEALLEELSRRGLLTR